MPPTPALTPTPRPNGDASATVSPMRCVCAQSERDTATLQEAAPAHIPPEEGPRIRLRFFADESPYLRRLFPGTISGPFENQIESVAACIRLSLGRGRRTAAGEGMERNPAPQLTPTATPFPLPSSTPYDGPTLGGVPCSSLTSSSTTPRSTPWTRRGPRRRPWASGRGAWSSWATSPTQPGCPAPTPAATTATAACSSPASTTPTCTSSAWPLACSPSTAPPPPSPPWAR